MGDEEAMGEPEDPKVEARRKLFGRAMVVLLGLLLAAYVVVTFWG
jgi:hypothetical protein